MRKEKINGILLEIILWIMSLVVLIPFAIAILGSFKTQAEAGQFSLKLPTEWVVSNYAVVAAQAHIFRSLSNSVIISAVSVLLCILISSMGAFILSRKQTRLSNMIYLLFYVGLIAPVQTIPTINLMQKLQIYGGYTNVILLSIIFNTAFSVFLYTGFYKSIPREIDEAAFIDGASQLVMYFKVIFPIAKPTTMTVTTLIFLGIWNDINIPLYFLNDSTKWTMPMSVYQFFGMHYQSWNLVFANIIMIAMPVFFVYIISQRYLVSGITTGAVKG
jgi:ABC-type sugar transport system, permease component